VAACLTSIGLALKTIPTSERGAGKDHLANCTKDYEKLQHDWLVTVVKHQGQLPHEHHRRAVLAVEKLDRSTRQLTETTALAAETEIIGNKILSDLYTQRETILRSRSNLRQVETDLDASSRTLTNMGTLFNRVSDWWSSLKPS